MRCHYEVLGVERDADDTDIKRSYRKLALTHHPDKNHDNTEDSTRIFHEIQAAYDVLSDKQERAWYDKHREAILKGGEDYVDDSVDVMQYFNPGVYSGFNDGPKGFYTVFRDVFRNISQEDEPYLEGESDYEVPDFGDSTSSYDNTVKLFYSYWLGYCTKKSFVWKEKYDLRQAPNRPTQRLMEKENKKSRDTAKKKRNEEVRALVAYVRKRDKRVQAYRKELEAKQAENQRKMEEKRKEDIRNRNKELDGYKEQEWMVFDHSKLNDIDSHFDEQFGDENNTDDSENDMVDHFYCIACDKNFKSEKALANHEKSKKHKENVELIKSELEIDLLEDLHIDQRKKNTECENETSECFLRLSSLNLPENVVKLNVIEGKKTSVDETNSESMISHTTDSLVYTKMKGTSSRQASTKIKEKKKKTNKQGKLEEDVEEREWRERHLHLVLSSQDSLFLPRKKSKKREIRDSAERMRQQDMPDEYGLRSASLGRSPLTDSMVINKKHTSKADRKKGRKLLLNSDEEDSSSEEESSENEEDTVFADEKNKQTKEEGDEMNTKSTNETDSVSNDQNDFEDENVVMADDEGEVTLAHLDRSLISDSIRYNKDKIEHHGKQIIIHKKLERRKTLEEESRNSSSEECINDHAEENQSDRTKLSNGEQRSKKNGSEKKVSTSTSPKQNGELFKCGVCEKIFPTRNKLFGHIKSEGHALLKDVPKKNKSAKKGKNKNK